MKTLPSSLFLQNSTPKNKLRLEVWTMHRATLPCANLNLIVKNREEKTE